MLFDKELNNNKLILVNLKFIEFFTVTLQFNLIKSTKFKKTELFEMIKIFLHIVILKQKQKDHDINFKKSSIKIL